MKKYFIIISLLFFSGCTHIGISEQGYLSKVNEEAPVKELHDFPMSLSVEMQCGSGSTYPTMGGVAVQISCSNAGRLYEISRIFKEKGLNIVPSKDSSAPHMSVYTKKLNGFLESTTGFFHLITLGIVPMYSYTDYVVSYKADNGGVDITRKVRVSSLNSWFSLLLSNPENLSEKEINSRVEENLMRSVLADAIKN